jgi:threonine/homoserine/homoserine lactone efflux protein
VFARAPAAFLVLRIGGTVYLAWLGARSLWRAWRRDPARLSGPLETAGVPGAPPPAAGFAQGLANNLVNPAIATFYLVVVPSFLADEVLLSARYVVYAALHIAMAFTYHSCWVWALHAMRTFWSRPHARRALETLTGVALLALAAKVAGIL